MKVLIVEDDEFKATDLSKLVAELNYEVDVARAASVTSALRAISSSTFDLVLLDMSLPTFDLSGPGGGGSPQGQGGVEVLRLAKKLAKRASFVIATQYPDIEIDGEEIPLAEASYKLRERFGLDILACILYEFDSHSWKNTLRAVLTCVSKGSLDVGRT